ncbi:MAG: response regulator transcription factor [Candidatus Limnocylindrales bacterium]
MHLLLVEDDVRLGRALARLLRDDRHVVDVAERGETALELFGAAGGIDAMILDIGLPDISGLEVARRIRASGSSLAIIMLTARDAIDDRVAGLDAGADDYLVKPFAYDELAARLRALDRRATSGRVGRRAERRVISGGIVLDEASRRVYLGGTEIDLSRQEFALLECLLRNPGRVLSRDELLDRAWPVGAALTPNAVEVYVHYLRTKLGAEGSRIQTVRGVGYRLAGP